MPLNHYTSIYKPLYNDDSRILIEKIPSSIVDPESDFIKGELIRDLSNFLNNSLSDLEKTVLLFYLSGRPYKEIASTLKVSYKSVDSTIWRIKKKCRRSKLFD
jgi:RNA polymerase sporulation-specific sigma factor